MPSLDEEFARLVARLSEPGSALGVSGDPFYYFAYGPDQTPAVRDRMPAWIGSLRNAGFDRVESISFADLLWGIIADSGRWEAWLEAEPDFDRAQVNAAVHDVLTQRSRLVERVAAHVSQERRGTVVLLTETETLHPFYRVRTLEGQLHDRVKVPTVVFYPGRRVGQYGLRFLDLYPEDSNYRATIFGGLP